MAINTYEKDNTTALSANFKVNEFSCHGNECCSATKIDSELVGYVQKIRDHFGKPVTVTSGYRCQKHNKAVGGASDSNHTKGMAADIVVQDVKPCEVAKYAESIGVLGIGLYEVSDGNFVHIDTRTSKSFWYGHAQKRRETFGGENIVKVWQEAAKADGFKLAVDGIWGSESESIAKKAICRKQLIGYQNKNLTKIVQEAVGVTADGKFGTATRNAVIKWQKLVGLTSDGVVGINTWKRILGVK